MPFSVSCFTHAGGEIYVRNMILCLTDAGIPFEIYSIVFHWILDFIKGLDFYSGPFFMPLRVSYHGHMFCTSFSKYVAMEKRTFGIILTILGILGLVLAGINFLKGGSGTYNIKQIITFGVLGAVFFFAGIGLIQNTRDKAT